MSPSEHLARFLANRTPEHRSEVITAYHHLCLRASRKFSRRGTESADLVQIASLGLIKAVDHYDAAFETPFPTYAWIMIVGELMHFTRDHERIVRLPRTLKSVERRYDEYIEHIATREGRIPTPIESSRALGVEPQVLDAIRQLKLGDVVSFESLPPTTRAGLGECRSHITTEDRLALMWAIEELGDRERLVLVGSVAAGYSQAEIGDRLGLSQSHVSKILKRALAKMQQAVA